MNNKIKSAILAVVSMLLLNSCDNMVIFENKGLIAHDEGNLILIALGLMLIVVIPVFIMIFAFAWKYRDRGENHTAKYTPEWDNSHAIEFVVWSIPIAIIIALATITWISSHKLDPYRPLDSEVKPVEIEVVALDWKWLFIYPEQGIATVNYIKFPANTPLNFKVTADAPMNSFSIPALGGQIYAMAGMQTQLHLIANENGEFKGYSANFSGQGFSGMKFEAVAVSNEDFNQWVKDVKRSPHKLDVNEYNVIAKPSEDDVTKLYSSVEPELFKQVVMKYMMPDMSDADHALIPMAQH